MVVIGETGSGKTTQMTQYLIEEGLITTKHDAEEFRGYSDYYHSDDASSPNIQEDPQDVKEDINLALRLMENNR